MMNFPVKAALFVSGIALCYGVPKYFSVKDAEKRDASWSEQSARASALDLKQGFTRVDAGSSQVAIYRDNITGCEWVAHQNGPLVKRTAPDANGRDHQICRDFSAASSSRPEKGTL